MKFFYSHLVSTDHLTARLDELDMTQPEKDHLAKLMDETLYQQVLDSVLDELDEKDKENFVRLIKEGEDQQVWDFLDKRVLNIEDKIRQTADDLAKKLHQDIDEAKQLKS